MILNIDARFEKKNKFEIKKQTTDFMQCYIFFLSDIPLQKYFSYQIFTNVFFKDKNIPEMDTLLVRISGNIFTF